MKRLLFLLVLGLPWIAYEVYSQAPVAVILSPTTSPSVGQPAVHVISVSGSSFPSGAITAAQVNISLFPSVPGAGPSATFPAASVQTITGTTRRVIFFSIPSNFVFVAPTPYLVSIFGSTSLGTSFVSGSASILTVNPPPKIQNLSPSSAVIGTTAVVAIASQFTDFVSGTTRASFGPGVAVGGAAPGDFGPVNVISPTSATAIVSINSAATAGLRTVTVATGVQQAVSVNGFQVIGNSPIPSLSTVSPNTAQQGKTLSVTLTGQNTHFAQGVTVASFGEGISVGGGPTGGYGPVTVTNLTSAIAQILIAGGATTGPRSVSVQSSNEQLALPNAFNVSAQPMNQPPAVNTGPDQTVYFPILSKNGVQVPADQAIYGLTTDGRISIIDTRTASTFDVGTLNIVPSGGYLYAGMDFNPLDGNLYVGNKQDGTLLRVDKTTATATVARVLPGNILENVSFATTPIPGPNGAMLPVGTLFGSETGNLSFVNVNTGVVQLIGSTGFEDDAYAVSPSGSLYGLDAGYPGNSTPKSALFQVIPPQVQVH